MDADIQPRDARDIDFDAPLRGRVRQDPINSRYHADETTGCWLWDSAVDRHGYGRIRIAGRNWKAHTLFYAKYIGPVPFGTPLDHLCHNKAVARGECRGGVCSHRRCVNPAHLRIATTRENTVAGDTIIARQLTATHCKNGHEWTEENTGTRTAASGLPARWCRACQKERNATRRSSAIAYCLAHPDEFNVESPIWREALPAMWAEYRERVDRERAAQRAAQQIALLTHCPQGHEYAPQNTRILSDGRRRCTICQPPRAR